MGRIFLLCDLLGKLLFAIMLAHHVCILVRQELLLSSLFLTFHPVNRRPEAQLFIIWLRELLEALSFKFTLAILLPGIKSVNISHRSFLPLHPFL